MAEPTPAEPVKLIVGILWSDAGRRTLAIDRLESLFGPIDYQGADHLFHDTDFYDREMGGPIYRRIVSHRNLIPPESLTERKCQTNRLEDELREVGARRVNLDAGYLDLHKVVLASMKPAGQKIPLADGVYADLTLRFARGAYQPLEWTFLDWRDGRYGSDLLAVRGLLREQLRGASPG